MLYMPIKLTFTFWQLLLNMQSLPKLEAFIHQLPKTVYVGDLRPITLELRNPCEIPVKVWPSYYSICDRNRFALGVKTNELILEYKDLIFVFTLEEVFKFFF